MEHEYEVEKLNDSRVHQGDILHNLPFYETYTEKAGRFELSILDVPYALVLTQECDLENYAKEPLCGKKPKSQGKEFRDKYLVSLLCAPLYTAQHVFEGTHLSELGLESDRKNSDQRAYIKQNRDPRYHYINFVKGAGLVAMVVDFKHYFTVSLPTLEANLQQRRICSLKSLYRELVSQRFSNFLSRIGLAEPPATNHPPVP